jgi:20S proteasome alpha/beta subunit
MHRGSYIESLQRTTMTALLRKALGVLSTLAITCSCSCGCLDRKRPSPLSSPMTVKKGEVVAPISTPLHGTINVLLGNRNGLVAVTDSRLSYSNGHPYPKPAPKLFKLDYQTICTVAGFYADYGPGFPGGQYPASMAASSLIARYKTLTRGHYLPLAKRVEVLTNIFQFSLNLVTRMNFAARSHKGAENQSPKPGSLVLTVAGYENGNSVTVIQVYLIASLVDGGYEYVAVPTQRESICANSYTLGLDFDCSLAGLSSIAGNILRGTDTESRRDPSAIRFLRAKEAGKLDALDVNEMMNLARYLKERSSDPPQQDVVGGPTQIAVLRDDKVALFDQPVEPIDWLKATNFNTWEGSSLGSSRNYVDGRPPTQGGMMASPTLGAMVVRGSATGIIQPLDNIIFIDSIFDHCLLTYDGSPMSMFDVSNRVIDSKLIVSPRVDMSTELIKQIRSDLPELRIEQGTLPFPQSWNIIQSGPPPPK